MKRFVLISGRSIGFANYALQRTEGSTALAPRRLSGGLSIRPTHRDNRKGAEMPESPLRLIKRCAEFQPKKKIKSVPRSRRGLYVLYNKHRKNRKDKYDVVYVGMTTSGIRGRLESHEKSKGGLWTHFSAFEMWDNIRDEEIVELEGLFRHLYRRDARANSLNVQRAFKKVKRVLRNDFETWT